MKIIKPTWVHHDDQPIFSIDVHPDSSRFATGGQGQDSGRIIIWNMGPIFDYKQEIDPNIPKKLCQMDHHIACVNVVRWSNNGLFLASGSDDKLIMIWHYVSGGSYQNNENWKCGHTLRAHNGDVLDLAWSSKDQFLASCSIDNTIIIWNALKFPDIITRINAHNGFVKGVAWDPVGTFFASQSDDKTVKIWKTLDWSLEKSIEEPFKNCTGNTHVLRLNWSPDGQLVTSAHAINNGAPTAQIIDRTNKWSTKLDFVGHRKAVTAVVRRFYPQILKEEEGKCSKNYCLCALGSRDRSISVWMTRASRPLVVLHDLFDNSIVDLTWSKKPKPALLACSEDGTVACVEFDNKEIGYPLSKQETEEYFMNKYNYDVNSIISIKDTNVPQFTTSAKEKEKDSLKFIENYDILLAQEKKQNELLEKKQQQQQNEELKQTATAMPQQIAAESQKQIERRMPDGRRRITPICVSKPGEYDTPRPFGSTGIIQLEKDNFTLSIGFDASVSQHSPAGGGGAGSGGFISRTATEQSTIIVEKRDEAGRVVEISPVKSIIYTKPSLPSQPTSSSTSVTSSASTSLQTSASIGNLTESTTAAKSTIQTSATAAKSLGNTQSVAVRNSAAANDISSQSKSSETKSAPTVTKSLLTSNEASKPVQQQPSKPSTKPATPSTNKPASAATAAASASATKSTISKSIPEMQNKAKSLQQHQQQQKSQANKATESSAATKKTLDVVEVTVATTTTTTAAPSTPKKKISHVDHHSEQRYLTPLRIDPSTLSSRIYTNEGKTFTLVVENSISLQQHQAHHYHRESGSSSLNTEDNDNHISLLKVFENEKTLKWQACYFSKICEATCNRHLVACVCDDGTLNLLKLYQGTQVCCPIMLDSACGALHAIANYCMCITVNGYLYVWRYESGDDMSSSGGKNNEETANFFNLTASISQLPCQFLLRERSLNKAFVTDSGVPVLQMSGNKSYFYSVQTKSWHLIPASGVMNKLEMCLKASTQFDGIVSTFSPLGEIQSRQQSSTILKVIDALNKSTLNKDSGTNRFDFNVTYLESQMNAAAGLNSPKEYKFWLMTYARYLIDNNHQEKLNELCYFLLGPLYSLSWNEKIMIFRKRDLLKEILPIIAQNVSLQRIYSFFKKQLNLAESMSQKSTTSSVLDRIRVATSNNNSKQQQSNVKLRSLESLLQPVNSIEENHDGHQPQQHSEQRMEVVAEVVEDNNNNDNEKASATVATKDDQVDQEMKREYGAVMDAAQQENNTQKLTN